MTTYEEFMVLLTFAILVVAILDYVNHKKQHPRSDKLKVLFFTNIFAGNG